MHRVFCSGLTLAAVLLAVAAPSVRAQGIATAPHQYVPPAWDEYLHGTLARAVRQRCVVAAIGVPPCWGWYDSDDIRIHQGGAAWRVTALDRGHTTRLPLRFRDGNGNGILDGNWPDRTQPGEPVWWDKNGNGSFETAEDTLLVGTVSPALEGAWGKQHGLFYADFDGNGRWDDAEDVWAEGTHSGVQAERKTLQEAMMQLVPLFVNHTLSGGSWDGEENFAREWYDWEISDTVYIQADGADGTTACDLNRLPLTRNGALHNGRPVFTSATGNLVLWYEPGVRVGEDTCDWFISGAVDLRAGEWWAKPVSGQRLVGGFFGCVDAARSGRCLRLVLAQPGGVFTAPWAQDTAAILRQLVWRATGTEVDQCVMSLDKNKERYVEFNLPGTADGGRATAPGATTVNWNGPWDFDGVTADPRWERRASDYFFSLTTGKTLHHRWLQGGAWQPRDVQFARFINLYRLAWTDIKVRCSSPTPALTSKNDYYLRLEVDNRASATCWERWVVLGIPGPYYFSGGTDLGPCALDGHFFSAASDRRWLCLASNQEAGNWYLRPLAAADIAALVAANEPPAPTPVTDIGLFTPHQEEHRGSRTFAAHGSYAAICKYDVTGGFASIDQPPGDSLPLTTAEVHLNTLPDTNRDDLVDIGTDLTAFGPDTGALALQPDRNRVQGLIPLGTGLWGQLQAHAYLAQGAFDLPSNRHWTHPDAAEVEQFWANSLHTRIDIAAVLADATCHIKRFAVVRPRGNAVLFDFPWDPAGARFSVAGYPVDLNEDRTYVLRDLTPENHADLVFDLQFDSGIVHHYEGQLTGVRSADGQAADFGTRVEGAGDMATSPRYALSLAWRRGRPAEAHYVCRLGGNMDVTLQYGNDGRLQGLDKSVPQLSVSGSDSAVTFGSGASISRAGQWPGSTVTLTGSLPSAGNVTTRWGFNARGLVTSLALSINGFTDEATFHYTAGNGRYANGVPQWSKLTRAAYSDGFWERFEYDTATGWLSRRIVPFKNDDCITEYGYSALQNITDPWLQWYIHLADPFAMFEQPTSAVTRVNGTEVGRSYWDTQAGWGGGSCRYQMTRPDQAWDSAARLVSYSMPNHMGPPNLGWPGGYQHVQAEDGGYDSRQRWFTTTNHRRDENRDRVNAFGAVERHELWADGNLVEYSDSETGAFGRITRTTLLDGRHIEYRDHNWAGMPQTIIEPDGIEVRLLYHDDGVLARAQRPALGHTDTFVFDALGRTKTVTRTGGDRSSTRTTLYDALGRLRQHSDDIGTTTVTFGNCSGSVTLPGGGTITASFYPDQAVREISGSAAVPLRFDYGIGTATGAAADSDTQRWWDEVSLANAAGGFSITSRRFRDMLGRPSCTQSRDDAGASVSAFADYLPGNGFLATTTDACGQRWCHSYNDRSAHTGSGLDADGDGRLDSGSDRLVQHQASAGGANFATGGRGAYTATLAETPPDYCPGSAELLNCVVAADGRDARLSVRGRTATMHKEPGTEPGAWAVTVSLPDGGRNITHYAKRLPVRTESYDAANQCRSTVTRTFDGLGAVTRETTTTDNVTRTSDYTYDSAGRLTAVRTPGMPALEILSFAPGTSNPTMLRLPDGGLLRQSYTPHGWLKSRSLVPAANSANGADIEPCDVTYDYTPWGAVARMTLLRDGQRQVTAWDYNPHTGLLQSKAINGVTVAQYTHGPNGRLESMTDALGVRTTCSYAPHTGDLTAVTITGTNADPGFALEDFDRLGRPARCRDTATGLAVSTQRDTENRACGETVTGADVVPDSTVWRSYATTHPDLSNVTVQADWQQVNRSLTYDSRSRVSQVGNGAYGGWYGDSGLQINYEYAPDSDRVARITYELAGDTVLCQNLAWDPATGRLQSLRVTPETAIGTPPVSVAAGPGATSGAAEPLYAFTLAYHPHTSKVSRCTLADGRSWNYVYDGRGQLRSARLDTPAAAPVPGHQFVFAYDSVGNLCAGGAVTTTGAPANRFAANNFNIHETRLWNGELQITGTAPADVTVTAQLLAPNGQKLPGIAPAERFPGGGFLLRVRTDNRHGPFAGTVRIQGVRFNGTRDEVATAELPVILPAATERPAALATGTLAGDSLWSYAFDVHGRLVSVTSQAALPPARQLRLEFTYFPDHRRARKRVLCRPPAEIAAAVPSATRGWQLRAEHQFVYDGWLPVLEKVHEYDAQATLTRTFTRQFLWGLDLAGLRDGLPADTGRLDDDHAARAGGAGGLLAIVTDEFPGTPARTLLPVCDHNGNVRQLIDAGTQTVVARYEYTPFGEPLSATGAAAGACPFRFSTKYWDAEAGLYYYGYRYYDPRTAKWLSRDPLGEAGGLNLTAFCHNDPINNVDPLGLDPWDIGDRDFLLKRPASFIFNWFDYGGYHIRRWGLSPLALLLGDKKRNLVSGIENKYHGPYESTLVIAVNGLNNTLDFYDATGANAGDFRTDLYSLNLGRDESTLRRSAAAGVSLSSVPYPIGFVYNWSYINRSYLSTTDGDWRRGVGATLDVLQAAMEVGGYGMVDATSNAVAGMANKVLSSGKYSRVILVGHSHGGIKVSTAMSGIRPWLRGKVKVVTYGSAHFKPFFGAAEAVHVHRAFDFVTNIPGQRLLRNTLWQPVSNALGLSAEHNETLPLGAVREADWMFLGLYPYTHSFEMEDANRNPIGYSIRIPQLLRELLSD